MAEINDIIFELENTNPDMRKERKRNEFKLKGKEMVQKQGVGDLFKLLKTLYTMAEWLSNDMTHEERKELIKEMLEDVSPRLIEELIDLIFDKKLYSKKTRYKKIKYSIRKCFRQNRENRD